MKHHNPSVWLAIIQRAKDDLKTNPVFVEMCKEHDFDPCDIDLVPVQFGDIDVSAKTEHGVVTLNWELLEPENRHKLNGLILHETTHFCQQSEKPTQSADDGNYLLNPSEKEGFQVQLEFIDNQQGPVAAEHYVNQVLDHHNETGKQRTKIKNQLMDRVSAGVLAQMFAKLARQL